jgi:hypothetical protein
MKSNGWLDKALHEAVQEVNSWSPVEQAATPVARYKAQKGTLIRITTPHFCAGLIVNPATNTCTHAAPILAWAIGKHRDTLRHYFRRKGWVATVVRSSE